MNDKLLTQIKNSFKPVEEIDPPKPPISNVFLAILLTAFIVTIFLGSVFLTYLWLK